MQTITPLLLGNLDLAARPAIVAVLTWSGAECLQLARQAREEGADLLELRADLCANGGQPASAEELMRTVEQVRRAVPQPLLLTVRHPSEGGRFFGTEREREELILRLLPAVDAVDLELYGAVEISGPIIKAARAQGKRVVLSFHDFTGTPPLRARAEGERGLEEIVRDARTLRADVVKIAARAETMEDVETLMRFTARCASGGVVLATMSMGEPGRLSRVLNPFFGSCLTYGYVGAAATTPGQWAVRELRPALDLFPSRRLPEPVVEALLQPVREHALALSSGAGTLSPAKVVAELLARIPQNRE